MKPSIPINRGMDDHPIPSINPIPSSPIITGKSRTQQSTGNIWEGEGSDDWGEGRSAPSSERRRDCGGWGTSEGGGGGWGTSEDGGGGWCEGCSAPPPPPTHVYWGGISGSRECDPGGSWIVVHLIRDVLHQ